MINAEDAHAHGNMYINNNCHTMYLLSCGFQTSQMSSTCQQILLESHIPRASSVEWAAYNTVHSLISIHIAFTLNFTQCTWTCIATVYSSTYRAGEWPVSAMIEIQQLILLHLSHRSHQLSLLLLLEPGLLEGRRGEQIPSTVIQWETRS